MNKVPTHEKIVSICIHLAVASFEEQIRSSKPVTNDMELNATTFFSKGNELLPVGGPCLTRITLTSVIVNASNMPDEIKSSR